MQNMVRLEDFSNGWRCRVFFDVKDGEIHNITLRNMDGEVTLANDGSIDEVKNILAREVAAGAIEMAIVYSTGQALNLC
jgi:hypothetical protein